MGFEHWIMAHFWTVIISSLVVLIAAHFGVVWLLRQGKSDTSNHATNVDDKQRQ